MKKRILSMLLCCLMLFGLVFTVSADPDQPEVDPVAHAITVTTENGTATASAETAFAGTEITLTAEANEGFRFLKWEVVEGQIEIADNKFVMPDEDVEVKAIFEAIPEVIPEEHSITIIPVGKGKTYSVPKTAVAGTEITLHAEPDSGWIFYGWEEVVEEGVDKVTIASDKFIMPDRDVVIRVIFVKESSIKVTTDGNGTASADKEKALNGEEITLTATPKEGYAFKEWQVIRGNVEIKDNKFVMPDEDVTVKAIFAEIKDAPNDDDMNVKRDIHFVLVKTDGNGVGVAYPPYSEAGTKVTVVAIAKPGYKFKEWKVVKGGVELENKSIATFEMPAENVILEAIFESDGTEGDKPPPPHNPKPPKPPTTQKPRTPPKPPPTHQPRTTQKPPTHHKPPTISPAHPTSPVTPTSPARLTSPAQPTYPTQVIRLTYSSGLQLW